MNEITRRMLLSAGAIGLVLHESLFGKVSDLQMPDRSCQVGQWDVTWYGPSNRYQEWSPHWSALLTCVDTHQSTYMDARDASVRVYCKPAIKYDPVKKWTISTGYYYVPTPGKDYVEGTLEEAKAAGWKEMLKLLARLRAV